MRHKYNIYNNSPTSFVLKLHIIKCVSFPAKKKKKILTKQLNTWLSFITKYHEG